MKRRLPKALAVLSLILFFVTGVLWVRSYIATEWLVYQMTEGRRWQSITFVSNSGQIYISRPRKDFNADGLAEQYRAVVGDPDGWRYLRRQPESQWSKSRFGFRFILSDVWPDAKGTLVFPRGWIPYWFVALVFLLLPALRAWQLLRMRKRQELKLCPTCGYDLRATPDRCPECGQEPRAATSA